MMVFGDSIEKYRVIRTDYERLLVLLSIFIKNWACEPQKLDFYVRISIAERLFIRRKLKLYPGFFLSDLTQGDDREQEQCSVDCKE